MISEQALENKFIEELVLLGYSPVEINNEEGLYSNLRSKLEQLNDYTFSDEEFSSLKIKLQNGNIFEKAKLLRNGELIKRDDSTLKEIIFFNSKEWCKNIFEVSNQIKMSSEYNNRYDVTLLINGFPLIQIELKKQSVSVNEAFGQIQRYKQDTMSGTLFDFVQIFVISNGDETKYIANNSRLDKNFLFKYGDGKNTSVNNLSDFTNIFLEPCQIGKYIARYIILSSDPENINGNILIAMRSYQVHAVEAILHNLDEIIGNGYVWHTTGSGKTLTSFKACEIISKRTDVDKVLFVVDRQDLDRQTVNEYKKFQNDGEAEVQQLANTNHLIELLNNSNSKIIVTTIQKLFKATGKLETEIDKNVVLIFDECHRSQLGDQHKKIDKFFKNPAKFGFTGTPIFDVNSKSTGEEFQTTKDVFNEVIHKYLIDDAIDDGNVLGFHIDYKLPFKVSENTDDTEVESINTEEVFKSLKYIKTVSEDVLETYDTYTQNKEFNAMLACDGIDQAIKYYRYIMGKEQTQDNEKYQREKTNLKVACIYSYTPNEEEKEDGMTKRAILSEIIKDYNEQFSTSERPCNYSLDTYAAYKVDVSRRIKNKDIDLIIVAEMFLTGFDAKSLNTLYYDKKQTYHNLIQTISRTNRVHGSKKDYGNVICYKPNMQKNVNEAIKLFSNGDAESNIIKVSYTEKLEILNELLTTLEKNYPSIDEILNLKGDEERKSFVKLMRKINREYNGIVTYREFEKKDLSPLKLDDLKKYMVQYSNLYEQEKQKSKDGKQSILEDLDFEINLINAVKIDYDYIKQLVLETIENVAVENADEAKEELLTKVSEDPKINKSKLELITRFLNKYLDVEGNIAKQYDDYIEIVRDEEIVKFSASHGIEKEYLDNLVAEYNYYPDTKVQGYRKIRDDEVLKGRKVKEKLFLRKVIDNFVQKLKTGDIF